MHGFAGPDGYELCRDFHDPGDFGACCVSRGDAEVMPYESGAGSSGIDRNIIAFRPTGSYQLVNCVLGVAYPGIPDEEDGPPRTESGQLINSVIQTSGPNGPGVPSDKDGMPWIGFAELVNSARVPPVTDTA